MKEHMAREILLELRMSKFIQDSGYVSLVNKKLYGRSGDHQINSYFKSNIPSAFSFPLRVVCQYKFYAKNKVDVPHIRDFSGIIEDLNQVNLAIKNYSQKSVGISIPDKYRNVGSYMSTTAFTEAAQEYAWAHDIVLFSFEKIEILQTLLRDIEDYVAQIDDETITNIDRKDLIAGYEKYCEEKNLNYAGLNGMLGILNGVYPVLLMGNNNWKDSIIVDAEDDKGYIQVEKSARIEGQYENKFEVTLKDVNLEFSVPNTIFDKLMSREDNITERNQVFRVDIPYVDRLGKRGIAYFDIYLEGFSKDRYGYNQISFF